MREDQDLASQPPAGDCRAAAPQRAGPAWRNPLLLAGLALLALLAVRWVGPRPAFWYPPCPFHWLTGLHCPGCGGTRAAHALVHGDLARAWACNQLLVVALPLAGLWGLCSLGWFLGRAARPAAIPRPLALGLALAAVVFGIVRNLPGWPWLPPG